MPTNGEIELAVERLSPNWARAAAPFFAADFVFVFRFFAMPASRLAGYLHKPCNKSKVQMINAAAELSSFDQPTSPGPERHGGKQYWLSTDFLNGGQAAAEISKGLALPVEAIVLTPDNLMEQVANGAMKLPSFVEATYGASMLEWVRQTYEGRLNFKGATSTVEHVTGNKPQTLEMWARANRQAILSAAL